MAETSHAVLPGGESSLSPVAFKIEAALRALIEHDATTVPDYSEAGVKRLADGVAALRTELAAVDRTGLSRQDSVNLRLVEAEVNALDFRIRVLRPWTRDPGFYVSIKEGQSDTPEHEGQYASMIDLWRFRYPLSAADADCLDQMLRTVPPLLEQARRNLDTSQTHDLVVFGARAFREQADALRSMHEGSLQMMTLQGSQPADMSGEGSRLLPTIQAALVATEAFADWVDAQAPRCTGPSGIGKDNYNWAAKHIALLPYDWDAQVALLRRELDRAWSSLALEEARNSQLPPLRPIEDAEAYDELWRERAERLYSFLVDRGFVVDQPYYRIAIAAQQPSWAWAPPDRRAFFNHIFVREPLAVQTHFYHWIELAWQAHDNSPDPLRRRAPILNVWQDRCEGVATAMEELTLQAGLYDDLPRCRELVWIMLANRAARGLASLYVQANEMTLEEAGRFHARWTPRGFADASSRLVAFEQLLYLQVPGYGPSYIIGKLQIDGIVARMAERAMTEGKSFNAPETIRMILERGFLPLSLIEDELLE